MVMRSNTMLFTDNIIHYGRRKSKRTADVLRSWENLHNYRYTEYGCKRKKYCEYIYYILYIVYSIGKITHVGKMKKKCNRYTPPPPTADILSEWRKNFLMRRSIRVRRYTAVYCLHCYCALYTIQNNSSRLCGISIISRRKIATWLIQRISVYNIPIRLSIFFFYFKSNHPNIRKQLFLIPLISHKSTTLLHSSSVNN